MKKTFTTLFAALLITSLSFAASLSVQQDSELQGAKKFTQNGKVLVIDGTVLQNIDNVISLIEKDNCVVAASSQTVSLKPGQEIHGYGQLLGYIKVSSREFPLYALHGTTTE